MIDIVRKRSYKFTDKKPSIKGIISTLYFLMSLGLVIYAISISFKTKGDGNIAVGALGIEAFLVAIGGFAMGLYSFKEDNVFLRFPWIGTIGNAMIWLFLLGVILVGL